MRLLLRALASVAAAASSSSPSPRSCPSRQFLRTFAPRPPLSSPRRKMYDNRSAGGYLRSRGSSPRIGEADHMGKDSLHRMRKPLLSPVDNKKGESLVTPKSWDSVKTRADNINSGHREEHSEEVPFDICKSESVSLVRLNRPLLEKNREKRKEIERFKKSPQHLRLESGLVLLKNFITQKDQVEIIKACQKLGVGPGGFYRPGYRDGAKLNLHMMCLGKNWNPRTRLYEEIRSIDGAEPPQIPEDFKKLVLDAIQTSHDIITQQTGSHRVEDVLPMMSPDLCIVNFYRTSGRLGLHQDRDESEESLRKGLPVVSFSLGDSADFLYGEGRDADKATKVVLESGDVLIFGGKSRNIFHGVPSIHSNTAPKWLLEETKLMPGRLNLTFRQY